MMNRRDFLKGLGAALACYGGAKLLPVPQREALVQWGRENGVIRPVWRGWDMSNGDDYTYATWLTQCDAEVELTLDVSEKTFNDWHPVIGARMTVQHGYDIYNVVHYPVKLVSISKSPLGDVQLYLRGPQ